MAFSFKQWYEQNGARLNESRRDRYQKDPDYKDRVLKQNQEARRNRKKSPSDGSVSRGKNSSRVVRLEGVSEALHTIGFLAEVLGCSVQTIRLWEKQGVIPPTPHRGGPNRNAERLYTDSQIEQIKMATASRRKQTSFKPANGVVK